MQLGTDEDEATVFRVHAAGQCGQAAGEPTERW